MLGSGSSWSRDSAEATRIRKAGVSLFQRSPQIHAIKISVMILLFQP